MKEWRLIVTPPLDGWLNMAIDELLLEEAKNQPSPPVVRFYQWEGDWVSFGYFQTRSKALNADEADKLGVRAVRRLTGGRAVLHSEDLTYSVIAGEAQNWGLGSSLKETYRQIGCALTSGFARLGLPVASFPPTRRGSRPHPVGPVPCFLTLSDYEIAAAGRKLVGSAQRREGSAFLQHGSIPLSRRNRELAERVLVQATPGTSPTEGAAGFRDRYATLEEAAGRQISAEALAGALVEGFAEVFGVEFCRRDLSPEQQAAAGRLAEKYATPEWNEKRPAAFGSPISPTGGQELYARKNS